MRRWTEQRLSGSILQRRCRRAVQYFDIINNTVSKLIILQYPIATCHIISGNSLHIQARAKAVALLRHSVSLLCGAFIMCIVNELVHM